MDDFTPLEQLLGQRATDPLTQTILRIAEGAARIGKVIGQGELAPEIVAAPADEGVQRAQQHFACQRLGDALSDMPVTVLGLGDENLHTPTPDEPASLLVTLDALDGAANISTNAPMGTIFSILLPPEDESGVPRRGREQLAAGFFIYSAYCALVLTLGEGVRIFTLDPQTSVFKVTHSQLEMPLGVQEYAINASNYRFWEEPVRAYVDDCIADEHRDREHFNMRWIGSLVAEAFRIVTRGGIFLYPRDRRPGFHEGRLRLVHAANPIALIIEQAGGLATDGKRRILDLQPTQLDEPVPFIFGSRDHVERVMRYHTDSRFETDHAPLFRHRGLFQA